MHTESTGTKRRWPYVAGIAAITIGIMVILFVVIAVPVMSGTGHSARHVTDFATVASRIPGIDEADVVSVDFDYEVWDNGFAPSDYDICGYLTVSDDLSREWLGKYEWEEVDAVSQGAIDPHASLPVTWLANEQFTKDVTGHEGMGIRGSLWFDGQNTVRYARSSF